MKVASQKRRRNRAKSYGMYVVPVVALRLANFRAVIEFGTLILPYFFFLIFGMLLRS